MKPACFDSEEQWEKWQQAELVSFSPGGEKRAKNHTSHCMDCTEQYAMKMRGEHRCEHSEVYFLKGQPVMTTNESGFKGVTWHKANHKWIASISAGRKKINLGYFNTAEEASEAYEVATLRGIEYYESHGAKPGGNERSRVLLRDNGA